MTHTVNVISVRLRLAFGTHKKRKRTVLKYTKSKPFSNTLTTKQGLKYLGLNRNTIGDKKVFRLQWYFCSVLCIRAPGSLPF